MEQQQQTPRLEVSPADLYALIGQLTVESRLLRARLAEIEQTLRTELAETQQRIRELERESTPVTVLDAEAVGHRDG